MRRAPPPWWWALLVWEGVAWREGKAERGKLRGSLADFLLCRANVDILCQLPWLLWGLFSTEQNSKWRMFHTYPKVPRGAARRDFAVSLRLPGLSEVDLPASHCPILWDWPDGHRCPLLTPPLCVNCPRQIAKLFLEPEGPRCTFLPQMEVGPGWLCCPGPHPAE